jgi:hypothetical protein
MFTKGKTIIKTSKEVGFRQLRFDYTKGFIIEDAVSRIFQEVWKPVWGQQQEVKKQIQRIDGKLKKF